MRKTQVIPADMILVVAMALVALGLQTYAMMSG